MGGKGCKVEVREGVRRGMCRQTIGRSGRYLLLLTGKAGRGGAV